MNRTQALAALILLVTVWLGACEKSDGQRRSGSDSGPLADAGFSDAYGLAHGVGVDSSLAGTGFGTCADDPQFLTECQTPIVDPPSPALPRPDISQVICTVAHDGSSSLEIERLSPVHTTNAVVAGSLDPLLAASTLSKRCDKADSPATLPSVDGAPTAGQVAGCSCAMKLCACG